MSNEDTMRQEFRKLHPNSEMQEQFAEAWKACAAIKDAEIADLRKQISPELMDSYQSLQEDFNLQVKEIAARDLMIKDLREVLEIGCISSCSCCTKTPEYQYHDESCKYRIFREALAKSEHHNSRALEIKLLEAEIGILNAVSGRKLHGGVIHTREYVNGYNAKVAETNKLLGQLTAKLAELNKE